MERYVSCGKPALVVAVPLKTKRELGMSLGYAFEFKGRQVVPAGININDGRRIDEEELEQDVYVMDKVEVAVNINTVDELRVAQNLFNKMCYPKLKWPLTHGM